MIPPIRPRLQIPPRLRREEPVHFPPRKDLGPARFAIAIFEMRESGQNPHGEEWDRCPKGVTRFRYKTTSTRTEHSVHLGDRAPAIRENGEKPRGKQHIETAVGMREFENVVASEPTIVEAELVSFFPGPLQLAGRTIDSQDRNFAEPFRHFTGVKPRAAPQFYDLLADCRHPLGPERANHSFRIVPEKLFAAKNVEPGKCSNRLSSVS